MKEKITLSQTLIKRLEQQDHCPMKIKATVIDKTHEEQTLAMLRGSYFETQVIGGTANGTRVIDLPRKRNGDTTLDQARIDMQVRNFPQALKKYGIKMPVDKAKQVVVKHEVLGYPVRIVIDFNSSISHKEYGKYPLAIFDVKLTKDKDNTFGDFAWGVPEDMDHLQAYLYSWVLKERFKAHLPEHYKVPFFYLVFDYKPEFGHKLVPIDVHVLTEDDLMTRIDAAITRLEDYEKDGWYARPNYQQCKNCPLAKDGTCKESPEIVSDNPKSQEKKESFFD